MNKLNSLYQKCLYHKQAHHCGAVPFQNGELLTKLIQERLARTVLEIGTGTGYSAACFALANRNVHIDSIDKDPIHIALAEDNWRELGIESQITILAGKAEDILEQSTKTYDLIFFDGFTPQIKMLPHFERLLERGGLLITTNLYLNNPTGGRYLKAILNQKKWQTTLIEDTALSIRLHNAIVKK